MAQQVSVYRFEYEIEPNMNAWNACIAAFSNEEAYRHLAKTVNKPIRLTSSTLVCRLDDLSAEIRANVVQAFLNKQAGQAVKKEDVKEDAKKEEDKPKVVGKK
jgi:hypothetical protein